MKSPVTIGSTTFPDYHYIGYGLPPKGSNGDIEIVPWMSGILRRDEDNTFVASGLSPQELEENAVASLNEIEDSGPNYVSYGRYSIVYLQSNNIENRWLTGSRNGVGNVVTEDILKGGDELNALGTTYHWILRSTVIDDNDGRDRTTTFDKEACFFAASCPEGLEDKGMTGIIFPAEGDTVPPYAVGADYGAGWSWTHPRLCCGTNLPVDQRALASIMAMCPISGTTRSPIGHLLDPESGDPYGNDGGTGGIGLETWNWRHPYLCIPGSANVCFLSSLEESSLQACPTGFTQKGLAGIIFPKGQEYGVAREEFNGSWNWSNLFLCCDDTSSTRTRRHRRTMEERKGNDIGSFPVVNDGRFDKVRRNLEGGVPAQDPKNGECVKYGDVVVLQNKFVDLKSNNTRHHRYEFLGAEEGLDSAWTSDATGSPSDTAFQFILRSDLGSGVRSNKDDDPAYGKCVQDLSLIYLQSNQNDLLWLSGGRGDENQGVVAGNFNTDVATEANYQWIIRKSIGDGRLRDGFVCSSASEKDSDLPRGKWVSLTASTGGPIEYSIGIHSRDIDSELWQNNRSWKDSIAAAVEGGLKFGEQNLESGKIGRWEMSNTVLDNLDKVDDGAISQSKQLGEGQVWQFVFEMGDTCDPSWELRTDNLVVTATVDEPPCCLPQLALDEDNLRGPCKLLSPCQCDESLCTPPSPDFGEGLDNLLDDGSGGENNKGSVSSGGSCISTTIWMACLLVVTSLVNVWVASF